MSAVTIQRDGQRLYFFGNTYPVKDRIKSMGGHWDGDRKAWWVGAATKTDAEKLVATLNSGSTNGASAGPAKVSGDERVVGKATYKGRSYYILWMGRCKSGDEKAHLTVLDGSIDFWADLSACEVTKRYQPREDYRTGRTMYQTLGGIRRFVEDVAEYRTEKSGRCRECGGPLVSAPHHRAMGGLCGSCAFDEYDH